MGAHGTALMAMQTKPPSWSVAATRRWREVERIELITVRIASGEDALWFRFTTRSPPNCRCLQSLTTASVSGPNPVEVVDRLRQLGWPSVLGNTDEALDEQRLPEKLRATFVGLAAARTREMLGPERVAWLTSLPIEWRADGVAVVHAIPGDCWAIGGHDA